MADNDDKKELDDAFLNSSSILDGIPERTHLNAGRVNVVALNETARNYRKSAAITSPAPTDPEV